MNCERWFLKYCFFVIDNVICFGGVYVYGGEVDLYFFCSLNYCCSNDVFVDICEVLMIWKLFVF